MELFTAYYESPVGVLKLTARDNLLTGILFSDEKTVSSAGLGAVKSLPPVLKECMQQLDDYFSGSRTVFELDMEQQGTSFQQKVWAELRNIPFGETISYIELARRIGNEKSIRAVGTANGRNNICIMVPCHRVIGSNGKLVGYGGGLWRKQWLLEHEQKFSPLKAGMLF